MKSATPVVVRPLGGWWIYFPIFLCRGFQQCMNPTDGRITTGHENLAACLFNPLGFVSPRIFFRLTQDINPCSGAFPDSRKKRTTFSVLGRKILPMVLRHMRGYHDRIPLTADLSWMDSHPVPVEEYFHCIVRHTDADRFPDQIIGNRILV